MLDDSVGIVIPQRNYSTFSSSPSSPTGMDHISLRIFETYTTSSDVPVVHIEAVDSISSLPPTAARLCKYCRKLYKGTENSDYACKYHAGHYASSNNISTAYGKTKRWTCCKIEAQDAAPCVVTRHVECERTTSILNTFGGTDDLQNQDIDPHFHKKGDHKPHHSRRKGKRKEHQIESKADDDSSEEDEQEEEEIFSNIEQIPKTETQQPVVSKEIRHQISFSDTLQGISLKYNVSIHAIKLANKLYGDHLFAHKYLIIPKGNALQL